MPDPMYELSRTVRFCVHPSDPSSGEDASDPGPDNRAGPGHLSAPGNESAPRHNTFAAWPPMRGMGAFYELHVTCRGEPNPVTGYMMSISLIDEHVRRTAIPIIERAFYERPRTDPAVILAELLHSLNEAIGGSIHSIRWQLTPYYAVAMTITSPNRVLISQQFEFAASHRLHCPSLTEQENQAVFGKCNNASGHGHNYRIEPVVSMLLDAGSDAMNLMTLERLVDEHIIQRFDHKHLNIDTEEFASLNPSVEHITRVCYDRLAGPVEASGGRLERITVWETGKTSCTYPAPSDY